MDPAFINAGYWDRIFDLVHLLWLLPVLAIGFAFFMLLAKAVVPSLIFTGNLSVAQARPLRLALYAVSFTSLALLITVFVLIVGAADIISQIYPKWWI